MYEDWKVAEPDDHKRKKSGWADFVSKMQIYYKPTENLTLKNYQFRALLQADNEAFPAFCNRVSKEAKHCNFKCDHEDCTAESTADQIIIGTTHEKRHLRTSGTYKSYAEKACKSKVLRKGSMSSVVKTRSTRWVNSLIEI
jgi:hypothetical protein